MLSPQPRLLQELPTKPSAGLNFRRLRRPTPLPTIEPPLGRPTWSERLMAMLQINRL